MLNDLWSFNLTNAKWEKVLMKSYIPPRSAGHFSCSIGNMIIILFACENILIFKDGKMYEKQTGKTPKVTLPNNFSGCIAQQDKIFINLFNYEQEYWILETGLSQLTDQKSEKQFLGEYEILDKIGQGSQGKEKKNFFLI